MTIFAGPAASVTVTVIHSDSKHCQSSTELILTLHMNDSLEYNTTVGQISVSNTPALSDYITKREASSPAERNEFKLRVRCKHTSDSPVLRLLLFFCCTQISWVGKHECVM